MKPETDAVSQWPTRRYSERVTSAATENTHQPRRRPFAAKYEHRKWGIALAIIGGLSMLGAVTAVGRQTADSPPTNPLLSIVVGAALVVWSVYLLRGQGESPAAAARRVAAEQRQAELAQQQAATAASNMDAARAALAAAGGGAAAVVAYRNLVATAKRWHPAEADSMVAESVAELSLDQSALQSPLIGTVPIKGGGTVEIYRDWIISGQEAHNVDRSTRGQVYVDGSIQVTSATVLDKRGKSQIVNTQHDMRSAQLQLTGSDWSIGVAIEPDRANDARRFIDQLATHVDTLKPQNVSAADIQQMVTSILNASGQPPAEKLKQLSNLRYERLLTDDEFEAAKARILGL